MSPPAHRQPSGEPWIAQTPDRIAVIGGLKLPSTSPVTVLNAVIHVLSLVMSTVPFWTPGGGGLNQITSSELSITASARQWQPAYTRSPTTSKSWKSPLAGRRWRRSW